MRERTVLVLEAADARSLIHDITVAVTAGDMKRVSVVVVDAHGDVIASERMDGATPDSMIVAARKAVTAARRRIDTVKLTDTKEWTAADLNGLRSLNPDYISWQGGVKLVGPDGTVVGGLGVSGESSVNDEMLGHNARVAHGLAPKPEAKGEPLTVAEHTIIAGGPDAYSDHPGGAHV